MYYVVIETDEYGDRSIGLNLLSEEQLRHRIFKFMFSYSCEKDCVEQGKATIDWLENLPNKLEIYDIWDECATDFPLSMEPDFELNYKVLQSLFDRYKIEKNANFVPVGPFLDYFMELRK
jgi:hypothetical protein